MPASNPDRPDGARQPQRPPAPARDPRRRAFTGSDAAKAGMLMLSVNALCAGAGAAVGALVGALVPLALAGFFVGFGVAVAVVARRYRDV